MKRSPLRKRKSLNRVSKKRREEFEEYKKLGTEFLKEGICERCGSHKKLDIHHKAGRGRFYLDIETWMAACRECHDYIHRYPIESREKGWLI